MKTVLETKVSGEKVPITLLNLTVKITSLQMAFVRDFRRELKIKVLNK